MPSVDINYRLALAWMDAGRRERALAMFRSILATEPGHLGAALGTARILLHFDRSEEAVRVLAETLPRHPNSDDLHKALTTALVAAGGWVRAAAFHGLARCDGHDHPIQPNDILSVTCVRNEALRLPFFLDYYRRLGIDRFLMVDNGSTDGTLALLLAEPDVMVWRTVASFNLSNFGSAWFEVLLRRYGVGHWCLTVDADEFLVYADCETRRLPDLCRSLDANHRQACTALLLDMYSTGPVADTISRPGDDLLALCPWFDRQSYHQRVENAGPHGHQTMYSGGARERVFGGTGYLLNKVPLLRYQVDVVLSGGQHWTNVAKDDIAADSGVLLHMKYLASFPAQAAEQSVRGEHYGAALQYVEYARTLEERPDLCMYDPALSVKFQDSRQLVELGFLRPVPPDLRPTVSPLPRVAGPQRPFWSVMVTVYQRDEYWPQALRSVLEAVDGEAQVEVVHDGENPALLAAVNTLAGDRAHCWCTPQRLGQPGIFNACLERSRGLWIHLLHDDDWVEEGFYRSLRESIEHAEVPPVAAFSRHWYRAPDGSPLRLSPLEAETAGPIPDWRDRIAVSCRLQTPAMVVSRHVYEAIGGYCEQARSAYDWDMWKRIAAYGPVWFEPTPLANFRAHPQALSRTLRRNGVQIADAAQSIALSSAWIPRELTREAGRRYAGYAVTIARQLWEEGDAEGAVANLREALRLDASVDVQNAVQALLTNGSLGAAAARP
ncbi:MAG TPA: glycosyltransferase family 2 protein [Candidatus Xenobia bacterium]